MQNGNSNQCAGTFTDSGGPANYLSNEDFTYTICPQNTGDILQLDFNSFNTQLTDVMTIYDGDDITAPVLGTFSGGGAANNPGLVEASGANAT